MREGEEERGHKSHQGWEGKATRRVMDGGRGEEGVRGRRKGENDTAMCTFDDLD